jgi:Tol biopolymer transport system component
LTFDEESERLPSWHPDGDRVYFQTGSAVSAKIMVRRLDGSGEPEQVGSGVHTFITADGRFMTYAHAAGGKWDLTYHEIEGDAEPTAVFESDAIEIAPSVSPDGRYIAYTSLESGANEIHIRKFPSGEGKWQVSTDGGDWPAWSNSGDELFYVRDNDLMVVDVEIVGESLRLGTPRRLFTREDTNISLAFNLPDGFSISPDSQRFLMLQPVASEVTEDLVPTITVVENWLTEFSGR